jgi:hypothetical protein
MQMVLCLAVLNRVFKFVLSQKTSKDFENQTLDISVSSRKAFFATKPSPLPSLRG